MEIILKAIIGYLVKYAIDGVRSEFEQTLQKELANNEALAKSIAAARPLHEELRSACIQLAQHYDRKGISKQEEHLWNLLSNEAFQNDLIEWFMAGGIAEGEAVKSRLLQTMEAALKKGDANDERIEFLKNRYFDALEKTVFSHPALAHWRHQMSLDYLREQVNKLRKHAEEAAGVYPPEKQQAALDLYCKKELDAWDIIDLSNLPEGDVQIATQQLLLRQLYMPLRINVEARKQDKDKGDMVDGLEAQRDARRRREAGHLFEETEEAQVHKEERQPVGVRLGSSRRLVVLGDPGGGKTTLLRWMATAYLLRHKGDPAYSQLPDTGTLPDYPWIPVIIRCRDLHESHLGSCFTDFLCQHLNKSSLQPEEARVMNAVILDRIAKGEILLLVDGLDEITNPKVRMLFCQELERTAARYPDAAIIATSRIVGYRDMPYRMGSGFEHGVIADLDSDDKDLFARRWVAVTEQHQPEPEKEKRAQELLEALHSSDRIERLTGNPMLLTTLALVKRKVGKLPNRRNKLYAEAVSVLLNWNPRLYQTIEETEAIPQLEYLAYEMCRRGVQRLTEEEVLDLLDRVRIEYPNIRAIRNRQPQEFLTQLEARSSILIKSGGVWQQNQSGEQAVWEFRHLTFQEYLAARALLDGRYPNRDKSKSLAEQVAPLAGAVEKAEPLEFAPHDENEMEVPESWREALRLLVADCKDDDVDEVLLSILNPLTGEDTAMTGRPRAILAALCLADEPNVSEETAQRVLATLVTMINDSDGMDVEGSSLDRAALEVNSSMWSQLLMKLLIQEFIQRSPKTHSHVGGLIAFIEWPHWEKYSVDSSVIFTAMLIRLRSEKQDERITAALAVMHAAYIQKAVIVPGLIDALMKMLGANAAENLAAIWALVWLSGGFDDDRKTSYCKFTGAEFAQLIKLLEEATAAQADLRDFLTTLILHNGAKSEEVTVEVLTPYLSSPATSVRTVATTLLGKSGNPQAVSLLLPRLEVETVPEVCSFIIEALGKLNGKQALQPLLDRLHAPEITVRIAVINALAKLGGQQVITSFLPLLDDDQDTVFAATAEALATLGYAQMTDALSGFLHHASLVRRKAAVGALLTLRNKPDEEILLSRDFDEMGPWLDPAKPITQRRIARAARRLKISPEEARARYEAIAAVYHLKFAS